MVHFNASTAFSFALMLQLLGVDSGILKDALTHKKITAKGEEVYDTYNLSLHYCTTI